MIFVTVGHQMPFDRLVRAMDAWAGREGRDDLFAQVGAGGVRTRHFESAESLPPARFRELMAEADAVVAHAGMGTIIEALELGRPLLVLPRRAHLGETRNDHQIATARHFAATGQVLAADDETDLDARLADLAVFRPAGLIGGTASARLIARLREFVFGAEATRLEEVPSRREAA